MKLSTNFSLRELTRSQVAARRGIRNDPPLWAVENLRRLCLGVLQPVRDYFHAPVFVSSGYRGDELERALKDKDADWYPKGQHPLGQAADFEVGGVSNFDVARWIAEGGEVEFDQLILEFYRRGDPSSGWVHCSYVRPPRGRVLRAVASGANVTYHAGLE